MTNKDSVPQADQPTQRITRFFESMQPSSIESMGEIYTSDAYFKDPFNEVRGLAQVQNIFAHMYVSLHEPHFVVTETLVQGSQCFIVWDFKFRFKRFDTETMQTVRGCSHLKLASDGRIQSHRDYWDAAEELYEKLPAVGALMRWLKKRANS
ncbi:MAG: nuclear transport factor 2 family protein [Brachymonas sp.]|nr:nuclear transport factor 2 family protein [Brachymonas sp.]